MSILFGSYVNITWLLCGYNLRALCLLFMSYVNIIWEICGYYLRAMCIFHVSYVDTTGEPYLSKWLCYNLLWINRLKFDCHIFHAHKTSLLVTGAKSRIIKKPTVHSGGVSRVSSVAVGLSDR